MIFTNTRVLPNGDLEISVDPDGDYDWDRLLHGTTDQALADLLEYEIGNGWDIIDPSDTGDLTSSPMICDDVTVKDDGTRVIYGNVWWFPNYQIESPIETLRNKGRVIFERAHKAGALLSKSDKHRYLGTSGCPTCGEPLDVSTGGCSDSNCDNYRGWRP